LLPDESKPEVVPLLYVDSIELELNVTVKKEGNGKFKIYVVDLGGKASMDKGQIIKNEQRNLSEDFEPGEVEWMRTKELIDGKSQFRADILRRIGQELYNTIFPDNKKTEKTFKKAYGEVNSESGKSLLHLKIQYPPNLSLLDNYPWELICKEGKLFCEYYCSISRMFDDQSGSSFQTSLDKHLLIISSSGYDDDLGRLESEKDHILESIKSIKLGEDIPIDCIPDLSDNTYTTLEKYLSSINRLDILHFDGHGR
jgi:hypothetical protein